MTIAASQVTVADTATEIVAAVAAPTEVRLHNPAAGTDVFLGPNNSVTTSNGYQAEGGDSNTFRLWPGDALYAIVAAGTQTLYVFTSAG